MSGVRSSWYNDDRDNDGRGGFFYGRSKRLIDKRALMI